VTARAPLKAQNFGWIWAVVLADALTLVAFAFPVTLDQAATWLTSGSRLAGASIVPVIVLLFTSLLSSEVKAALVFWRTRDVLPGHRAFSVYAAKDPRVDLQRLRADVGEFPQAARDQNALWYRLFKKVEGDPAVAQAHRHFLLFRDLAALSLLLGFIAPVVLDLLGSGPVAMWLAAGLFGLQYLAAAIAGRLQGVRLVCNVLALRAAAAPPGNFPAQPAADRPVRPPRGRTAGRTYLGVRVGMPNIV
jgi:hypothetical protein